MFRNSSYIYAVYKERSFSKAAEKLSISQPSLSATVKKEEMEAGAPIFDRSTIPVTLTPFGKRYIAAIEQIRGIEKQLSDIVGKTESLQAGKLSVGCTCLSMPWVETDVVAGFMKKYPGIQMKVVETTALESKQMLDAGELDLIINDAILDRREYENFLCYRENLIVAVPKCFKFEEEEGSKVPLALFKKIPFILLTEGNYLRSCTDTLFREAGFTPEIVLEVEHSATAYNFANYGIGATIISDRLTAHGKEADELKYYGIDSENTAREAYVYYRKSSYVTSAMKTFMRMLMDTEQGERGRGVDE